MVQIQWYIIRVVSSIALKNNRTAWSMEEESINRRRARAAHDVWKRVSHKLTGVLEVTIS